MSMLAVPIISVLALVLSLVCLIIIILLSSRNKVNFAVLESQSQAFELLIANLQSANEQLQRDLESTKTKHEQASLENIQVSKQLEHRIKTLQDQVGEHQASMEQLQLSQGEDKFYSRAIKLAKKGAKLEEIIDECELPAAEVEMLLSVYQSTSHS